METPGGSNATTTTRLHWSMHNDATVRHTVPVLRYATIRAGVVGGTALVIAYVINAPIAADAPGLTAQDVYNAVIFVGAMAWFVTNAFRWLQERLLQPWNHIVFATVALAALGVSIRTAFDSAFDPPNDIAAAIYQAVLTCSLIVVGSIAIFSAWQRPTTPDNASNTKFNGMIRLFDAEPLPGRAKLRSISRWVAIAGGIVFAAAQFASPTVIPAAVALTCAVRYVGTARGNRTRHVSLHLVATTAVVLIHVAAIALFLDDAFLAMSFAISASLMLVALAISASINYFNSTQHPT